VGNIPFGSWLSTDGKRLERDAAEQATLCEISRLRDEGTSLRGIAATFNQSKTPSALQALMTADCPIRSGPYHESRIDSEKLASPATADPIAVTAAILA
jgi:hypothetical protein